MSQLQLHTNAGHLARFGCPLSASFLRASVGPPEAFSSHSRVHPAARSAAGCWREVLALAGDAAAAQDGAGGLLRMRGGCFHKRTIVFYADKDTTVHPSNGEYVLAQAGAAAGDLRTTVEHGQVPNGGRTFTRTLHANDRGMAVLEQWIVHGGATLGPAAVPRAPTRTRRAGCVARDAALLSRSRCATGLATNSDGFKVSVAPGESPLRRRQIQRSTER